MQGALELWDQSGPRVAQWDQRIYQQMVRSSSAGYLLGPWLGGRAAVLGLGASPATLFPVDAETFVCSAVLVILIGRPLGRGRPKSIPALAGRLRLIAREPELRLPVLAGWSRLSA
jgi:hypothetical protein